MVTFHNLKRRIVRGRFWTVDTFFEPNWGIKYLPAFDKLLHFQLFSLAMMISTIVYLACTQYDFYSIVFGLATGWSLIGGAYEFLWQMYYKNIKPSWRDLVANEIGIGLHGIIIVTFYNLIT